MAEKAETIEQNAEDLVRRSEQLGREALGYWQTVIRGLMALPSATSLSVSSAILYATGVSERAYRRIESLSGRIGQEVTRELAPDRVSTALPERQKRQPSA